MLVDQVPGRTAQMLGGVSLSAYLGIAGGAASQLILKSFVNTFSAKLRQEEDARGAAHHAEQ